LIPVKDAKDVKDKTSDDTLTCPPGFEVFREPDDASKGGASEERGGRRAGMMLVLAGCGLMLLAALSAAQAPAGTPSANGQNASTQESATGTPWK
jgi:hypothetical protein